MLSRLEQKAREKAAENITTVVIRKDYGIGIRPMRLFNNKIYDADEYGHEKSSSENEDEKQNK